MRGSAILLLIVVTAALSSVAPAGASRTIVDDPVPNHPLALDLPIMKQHSYRMAGKVRMLLPAGVRSGFLTSLTELVNKHWPFNAGDKLSTFRSLPYVHGDRLFELRPLESTPFARFERDRRTFERVIFSRFETAQAGSPSGTRFELVYGTSGPMAGIPILVSYQPKLWLQVDLVLHK